MFCTQSEIERERKTTNYTWIESHKYKKMYKTIQNKRINWVWNKNYAAVFEKVTDLS